mgnify:FL=1
MNDTSPQFKHAQNATVRSINGMSGLLVLSDGQVLNWPIALLPPGIQPGQNVKIILHDGKTDEQEKTTLAHDVLNEIFKSKES